MTKVGESAGAADEPRASELCAAYPEVPPAPVAAGRPAARNKSAGAAASPPRIRVAVVDDDPAVLRSIGRLLRGHGYETELYSSPEALLADIASLGASCLVADLAMPESSGLEVQQKLAARQVKCPIVFVTAHGNIRTSVRAMQGGAVDFLTKPFDAAELLEAIGRAISRSRRTREVDDRRAGVERRAATLTPRECEVFGQVITGLLNKQIAANLGISEKTVKVHRGRVMRKMAVRSVAELVRAAEWLEAGGR